MYKKLLAEGGKGGRGRGRGWGQGEGEVGGGVEGVEDLAAHAGNELAVDEMLDCSLSELLADAV